jgi:hypothetical protein
MQIATESRIITSSKVNFELMYRAVSSFKKLYPELWTQLTPEQQKTFGDVSSERSYTTDSNETPMLVNVF